MLNDDLTAPTRHPGESRNPAQHDDHAEAIAPGPGFRQGHEKRRTLRHSKDLADAGLVSSAEISALEKVAARYAIAITPAMAELIDQADPADPIARQFVPDEAELTTTPEERDDPIGDDIHEVAPGLVHRYADRVLLKFVSACAVYCRFCFRRETVGQGGGLTPTELEAALDYVRAHPEIWEIIVSGGDPLIATPRRLRSLMERIAAIPHVKVVRFHTRVPVVSPGRVTPELVASLKTGGMTTWVAIHANHPRELTADARAALARIADAGIPLVSQTVLLRGVNDDPETLAALMRGFVEARVKPYYLHHPDMAPGTAAFRLPIAEGQAIMRNLRGRLSGMAQPAYVLDIPGGHGKVPVGPTYLGDESVTDPSGAIHRYPPGP